MLLKKSSTLINKKRGKWLKLLIPKQICQRLPIALAQAEATNTSED